MRENSQEAVVCLPQRSHILQLRFRPRAELARRLSTDLLQSVKAAMPDAEMPGSLARAADSEKLGAQRRPYRPGLPTEARTAGLPSSDPCHMRRSDPSEDETR